MIKKILGLDLGIASIGWAFVNEGETAEESSIKKLGVRVVQFDTFSAVKADGTVSESKNPIEDFRAGRGLSPNAARTKMRTARKMLRRFKYRRENLIQILQKFNLIDEKFIYAETEKDSTYQSIELRAKVAREKVSLEEFARVLLMINKKRGYKSSRKTKVSEEGFAIDNMEIALLLKANNLTPGEYLLNQYQLGKKNNVDFYQSDLKEEFYKIWKNHELHYPEICNPRTLKDISGKGSKGTKDLFYARFKLDTADIKNEDKKLKYTEWRVEGLTKKLDIDKLLYVIVELNNEINKSSGYLGAISDRSKELKINNITVGEYQLRCIQQDKHSPLKKQIFYRQDYVDEFNTIWDRQSKEYPQLTAELKIEIRDKIIFYQRKLKSQKKLVSKCNFYNNLRVMPKSSPLFQDCKIWQQLNNIIVVHEETGEFLNFSPETKEKVYFELTYKGKMTDKEFLTFCYKKSKNLHLNFKTIEGNNTISAMASCFANIVTAFTDIEIDKKLSATEYVNLINKGLVQLGFPSEFLNWNSSNIEQIETQAIYNLWHKLYSIDDDAELMGALGKFLPIEKKMILQIANIPLQPDYGNISAKACKKILPFLQQNLKYSEACKSAGFRHSNYETADENDKRELLKPEDLKIIKKAELRNPVVEKILNQMIHLVKEIAADPALGVPDEIRIELARELKKSAKEKQQMDEQMRNSKKDHDSIVKLLQNDFIIKNPTRNDIIKYKLYRELETTGYKTLYSNTFIDKNLLYSSNFEIEHIIPRAKIFDDSFSNKTLEISNVNKEKDKKTAFDYMETKGEAVLEAYKARVLDLWKKGKISKTKYNKLLMKEAQIPNDFLDRDIRETQYIAKKAKEILSSICKSVVSSTGEITDRLRSDWQLTNVMQELNFEKYKKAELTEWVEKKDGSKVEKIKDWTKRNDHRHHAVDALTVAFTKHAYIQYLNNLNAKGASKELGPQIIHIENKYLEKSQMDSGNFVRLFKPPVINMRAVVKDHLEKMLVSFKSKNRVVTKNKIKLGENNVKTFLTPRGQLHKETVYGCKKIAVVEEIAVDAKLSLEKIELITKPLYKALLKQRLIENENNPKKAFAGSNSLAKKPIFLDVKKTVTLPEKVKIKYYENEYTIRKEINAEFDSKKIEKVLDEGIKRILSQRLKEYKNEPKKAFTELDKNPIWLNKEKGIQIKSVVIGGVKNAESLHIKRNHLGKKIELSNGDFVPSSFINTGNNHHVAIYQDEAGNLYEQVVSFYEAANRALLQLPIVQETHSNGAQLLFTMKQNDYFLFPSENFNPKECDIFDEKNAKLVSQNLFRVQSLSIVKYGNATVRDFIFRHHLETTKNSPNNLKGISFQQLKSLEPLNHILKVKVSKTGSILPYVS